MKLLLIPCTMVLVSLMESYIVEFRLLNRARLLAVIGLLFAVLPYYVYAIDPNKAFHVRPDPDLDVEELKFAKKKPKRKTFKVYTKAKDEFEAICNKLERDGRKELIYKIVTTVPFNSGCLSCKDLFRAFSKGCKTKPVRKKDLKEGEEPVAPKSPVLERVPSPALISILTQSFVKFSNDTAFGMEHYEAVMNLVDVFKNYPAETPGARDYLLILSEYIFAPFQEFHANHQKQEQKQAKEAFKWRGDATERESELDKLFGN